MTTRVDVDRWVEGSDVNGLFDAATGPILFVVEYGSVLFAEMMAFFSCMLEHCGLEVAKSIGCCGGVLLETGGSSPLCFSYVSARAWNGVGSCTWNVVNDPVLCFFFQLVFGFDKVLSKRSSGFDGGAEAFRVEKSGERFGNACEEWKTDITKADFGCKGGGAC